VNKVPRDDGCRWKTLGDCGACLGWHHNLKIYLFNFNFFLDCGEFGLGENNETQVFGNSKWENCYSKSPGGLFGVLRINNSKWVALWVAIVSLVKSCRNGHLWVGAFGGITFCFWGYAAMSLNSTYTFMMSE